MNWLRCFVRAIILYAAVTYREADGISTKSLPQDCLHEDPAGNKYNLTTLRNINESARFEITYRGFTYSFNPCISFKIGKPSKVNECQLDVAICMWVENQMYHNIGHQSKEKCIFDKDTNTPKLEYSGDIFIKKADVLLKCKKTKERPSFKALSVDDPSRFVFALTHKCACPDLCLYKHITPTEQPGPGRDDNNDGIVAGSIGGFFALAVVAVMVIAVVTVVKRIRRMNRPNYQDDAERRPIMRGNVNQFPGRNEDNESNLERSSAFEGSSNSDIKATKEDFSDSENKSYAEGRC